MKLNLGAGSTAIKGYKPMDGKKGDTIYPLKAKDVEEIRASHVLEHFPHGEVLSVLKNWVEALKPGGTLRVAVPDFRLISEHYLSGRRLPVQGYVMGGQTDDLDYHKVIFDEDILSALMREAGLVAIRRWTSEIEDCAALPISLNLAGTKPGPIPRVAAVLSVPRLGFNDFWAAAYQELASLGIPMRKSTGAYWDRDLTIGIEQALDDHDPEWILTCDYDTVFTRHQVADLLSIASRYPHADAIAPLQTARHHDSPMFTLRDPDGELIQNVGRDVLCSGEVIRAETAHFGLTLLRAEKLRALPRPWFSRKFDSKGGYDMAEGLDPDVNFWHVWKDAGNSLYVALRVPVGHCELMVRWPDTNLEAAFQRPSEFWKGGPPENVWR